MEPSDARAVIKFLMLQGKTPTEIHREMEPVFQKSCPSYASVKNWCRQFKCGRSNVADMPRCGRPSSECTDENAEKVMKIIDQDRKMTIEDISSAVKLSKSTVTEREKSVRPLGSTSANT